MMTLNRLYICSFVILLSCITIPTVAQNGQTTLRELKVVAVWARYNHDDDDMFGSGNSDYRWKFKLAGASSWIGTCIGITGPRQTWFDAHAQLPKRLVSDNTYIPDLSTARFDIELEAFDNDGCGDGCNYGTGWDCYDDDGLCRGEARSIDIRLFPPAITNEVDLEYCSNGATYRARCQFLYDIPVPQTPSVTVNVPDGAICAAYPTITLTTNSYLHANHLPHVNFIWQYSIGNLNSWQTIPENNTRDHQFSFSNIRSLPGLQGITTNTNVYFRVITQHTHPRYPTYSSTSSQPAGPIVLSPLPPSVSSVTVNEPSCFGKATSKIRIDLANSIFARYGYVIKENGTYVEGAVKDRQYDWNTYSYYIETNPIRAGNYTIEVTNGSGNTGVCPATSRYITVPELPSLQLHTAVEPVSCQGNADALVTLTSSGGKQPIESYSLIGIAGGFSASNQNGTFTGLGPGTYLASVVDACGQADAFTVALVEVNEPVKVNAAVSSTAPLCNAPADGSIQINVTEGNEQYLYKVRQGSETIQELTTSSASWLVTGLSSGIYTVEVMDAQRLSCEGFVQDVELSAPPVLHIDNTDIVKTDVTCYAQDNGSIELRNVNISGDYVYMLTSVSSGSSQTLTTESRFMNLPADRYSLQVKRNIDGCRDQFTHPSDLVIDQPEEVIITLQKEDISCHGMTDGLLSATVSGATSSDSYTWETRLNDNWASLNNNTIHLTNLHAGWYRMRSTNANHCEAISAEAEIIEPALLAIASIQARDVVCFAEKGVIETHLQGGVTPYSYEYTSATGEAIISSTAVTQVDEGTYAILVKDANNCEVSHPALTITAPDSPLNMSLTLSDYNGYGVSCLGASDGYVDVTVSGGNGASYTGYTYALDDRPFQDNARIDEVTAGQHTIATRDNRGCLVQSTVSITEPAALLQARVLSHQDVKCQGDTDGVIEVAATGGLEPYQYVLNNNVVQSSGLFSSLESGDYTILLFDRNDCRAVHNITIAIEVPPMEINLHPQDVRCNGGADGAVNTEVTGGIQPYKYTWNDGMATTAGLVNIPAGSYALQVVDGEGCSQSRVVTVAQPEKLSVTVKTTPVCVGRPNGEIKVGAAGGVPGYRYSIDGVNYQELSNFAVPQGDYEVYVTDANLCGATASANIVARNDLPQPNFIVATTQQASDTLVVKEISVPKPDSIVWTFDPAIVVIGNDVWSPMITVPSAGSYSIGMKGFFGGCDYAHSLVLTVNPYDPEVRKEAVPVNAIKKIEVSPNPSQGEFNVSVELAAKQRLSLIVSDMLGIIHYKQNRDKVSEISERIDISTTATPGVYVVQVITDTDAQEIRVVVNK